MIAVIIAGGLGSRLWPLSTPVRPKQFLCLTSDSQSLIRQTYDRISPLADDVFVVVPRPQVDLVYQHLPELDPEFLIVEPARRGVANAIFLSLRQLVATCPPDQPLLFLWGDHWIGDDDQFRQSLTVATTAIEAGLDLIRFGVQPTFAATNFGYLQLGSAHSEFDQIYRLEAFYEKPDRPTAEQFLADEQYLWNMGYFMTTVDGLQRALTVVEEPLQQSLEQLLACPDSNLDRLYRQLPKASFERKVAEQLGGAHAIRCDFPWADIGSFRDLLAVLPADDAGNVIRGPVRGHELAGSYVDNQTDIPLAVVGLQNLAVVVTNNGILVADPTRVAEIGSIAKLIRREGPPASR